MTLANNGTGMTTSDAHGVPSTRPPARSYDATLSGTRCRIPSGSGSLITCATCHTTSPRPFSLPRAGDITAPATIGHGAFAWARQFLRRPVPSRRCPGPYRVPDDRRAPIRSFASQAVLLWGGRTGRPFPWHSLGEA